MVITPFMPLAEHERNCPPLGGTVQTGIDVPVVTNVVEPVPGVG